MMHLGWEEVQFCLTLYNATRELKYSMAILYPHLKMKYSYISHP